MSAHGSSVDMGPVAQWGTASGTMLWSRPLRSYADAANRIGDGLRELDITLDAFPPGDGYRQIAGVYVDALLDSALMGLREGTITGPSSLAPKLSEFYDTWRWVGDSKDILNRQAAAIADLATDVMPGLGVISAAAKQRVASSPWVCLGIEALLLLTAVILAVVSQLAVGTLAALAGAALIVDGVFKVSAVSIQRVHETNQQQFDTFSGAIGQLLRVSASSVNPSTAAGNPLLAAESVDDTQPQEDVGTLFAQPTFLLDPEDALQRKRSIDDMLGEADDDEGFMHLRVKGFSKVTVDITALNPHLMLVMTDVNGKVVFWNEGAAAACGFSSHDAEGKHISSFLFGEAAFGVYERMADSASRGVDLSAKPLTVAHMTYGHVTVKATVTSATDANKDVVGFVLIASQQESEGAMNHAVFHHYYLHELVAELHNLFVEQFGTDDVGRSTRILDRMSFSYLRDLASASKDWSPVLVQSLLNEALKDRHRQVDVRIHPQMPDQIVCDQLVIATVVARTIGLLTGKLRLTISHNVMSPLLSRLVITAGPALQVNENDRATLMELAATVGGESFEGPNNEINLTFPYLVEGAGGNMMDFALNPSQAPSATKAIAPMTILLLEKNAVYRHNISAVAWAGGHSLRLVETVAKAMKALSEGAAQFGCAIVDIDIRDVAPLLNALRSAKVYLIETTESDAAAGETRERGRVVLAKPLGKGDLEEQLELASAGVLQRKRDEEEIVKRREIFGKVRNSPWTRGRKLGHGAFAEVYEATSTLTGGKMAVKMIRYSGNSEEKIKVLINEIEILCQLSHPNIVHYFYCERGENTINLFMELATEGSLQDLLLRDRTMTEEHLAGVTKQLLLAVHYLHDQGIIHRDIKPGNILLSGGKVKLTDFGTATHDVADDTQGTIYYMAPEVLDGVQYTAECDIWSIGCVVCECLGIKRQSRPGTLLGYGVPGAFPHHLSPAAVEFINLCMQDDPGERAPAGSLLLHDFIVGASSMSRGEAARVMDATGRRGSVMSAWTVDEGSGERAAPNDGDGSDSTPSW